MRSPSWEPDWLFTIRWALRKQPALRRWWCHRVGHDPSITRRIGEPDGDGGIRWLPQDEQPWWLTCRRCLWSGHDPHRRARWNT